MGTATIGTPSASDSIAVLSPACVMQSAADSRQDGLVDDCHTVHQRSQRCIDERPAIELLPAKGNRLPGCIVEKRAGVVELRRPGNAGQVELFGGLRNDSRGLTGHPINERSTGLPGRVNWPV